MAGLILRSWMCQCLLVVILLCYRTFLVNSQIQCETQEATDLKTYRTPIVVEGEILDSTNNLSARIKVKRDCKKLSGNALKSERIKVIGFGSLNPCIEDVSEFETERNYMFYINVTDTPGEFQLTGNPDVADKKVRRVVKSTVNNGGPPKFTSSLKRKRLVEGTEYLAKCSATGNPLPDITWKKDNITIAHTTIPGLRIRTKKKKKTSSQLRIKRVKEAIHEGSYSCIANNHVDEPIVTSGLLQICALKCEHGELNSKRCQCKCEKGWIGTNCDCPVLNCGNGSFNRDLCQCECNDGYIIENGTCVELNYDKIQRLCDSGEYCANSGTCAEKDGNIFCNCRSDVTGPRCETFLCEKQCQNGGTLDPVLCRCSCDGNFTGATCDVPIDKHHHLPCTSTYAGYCLNGGTCTLIGALQSPSCFCSTRYKGERCEFIRSQPAASFKDNSKKLIICIAIIFISIIIVIGLLLLGYIKNKNARERERQEWIERQRELQVEHSLRMGVTRPNNFSLATVPANSIELKQFRRPSAPQPQCHQSDGNLQAMQGTFHSRSVDGRLGTYGSGSLQRNSQTPNGHTRKVSQASMQSTRSNGSLRSAGGSRRSNSVGQRPANKSGYETVPTDEPEETETPRIEVVDEGTPLRSLSIEEEKHIEEEQPKPECKGQDPLSTETESEIESNNGDVYGDRVDDLNPQLEALHAHPALKEELETEDSVGEYSSDLGYSVNPYVMESPVRKVPHRTRNRLQGSSGTPRHMGIYSNPMEGNYPRSMLPTTQAIDIQDESGYYAQRLRDVVENSPPSAV